MRSDDDQGPQMDSPHDARLDRGMPTLNLTIEDEELSAPIGLDDEDGSQAPRKKFRVPEVDVAKIKKTMRDNPQYIWAFFLVGGLVFLVTVLAVGVVSTRRTQAASDEGVDVRAGVGTTQTADDRLLLQLRESEQALRSIRDELNRTGETMQRLERRQQQLDRDVEVQMEEVNRRHNEQVNRLLQRVQSTDEWTSAQGEIDVQEETQGRVGSIDDEEQR